MLGATGRYAQVENRTAAIPQNIFDDNGCDDALTLVPDDNQPVSTQGVTIETLPGDVAGVEAVLVLRPVGIEAEHGAIGEAGSGIEERRV